MLLKKSDFCLKWLFPSFLLAFLLRGWSRVYCTDILLYQRKAGKGKVWIEGMTPRAGLSKFDLVRIVVGTKV